MKLEISDKKLGEILINSNRNLNKTTKQMLKALCALQMMCINSENNEQKREEFLEILRGAISKIEELFEEDTQNDPVEFF